MERAGEILGRAVRRMSQPEAALAWLEAAWPEIVGPALAGHTRPLQCAKGRLDIAADGKNWERQIESMGREFCDCVNQAWGATLVREIRFVHAPSNQSIAPADDNRHTPFVRRRMPPK